MQIKKNYEFKKYFHSSDFRGYSDLLCNPDTAQSVVLIDDLLHLILWTIKYLFFHLR